jgi:hypothetical protein
MGIYDTREGQRLRLNDQRVGHWNRWGPYLSERAWGTVREDYSPYGTAWDYFPHDDARSRTYRWNEDGLGGISDRDQFLCFALALWNGRDPILKERMFGLTNSQGNHGEDVKEYYYYLDNTPTHSYMRFVYKYPHAAYPYDELIRKNAARNRNEMEYELIDTGVFDESRYFDVEVEYAKLEAEDLLIRIVVSNRGPQDADITVLPTLWFRNTWSWGRDDRRPFLSEGADAGGVRTILADHYHLHQYALYCSQADDLLFTENETNMRRLYNYASGSPYVKDAFHSYVIENDRSAVNPARTGTKAAALYKKTVPAGQNFTISLRLAKIENNVPLKKPFDAVDQGFTQRKEEADEFYASIIPATLSDDAKNVARQAFAGQLWSKQFYYYVVKEWLEGDPAQPPPPPQRLTGRNHKWKHVYCRDVLSMPDTWEFPWFASWDLAFHCAVLAYIDPQFAKDQVILMLREWYTDEDGATPAYEWAFSDVNPPVLAWAAVKIFKVDQEQNGNSDYAFLEEAFQKLLINFTWWANRKDALDNDIFQGGFLGLDNIDPFDRDALPAGYLLGQVDGTSWMAVYAKHLFEISIILAERDPVYEAIALKFWQHFITIANAMNGVHDRESSLWDEQDGFFYGDLYHNGTREPVRARTMVGFVPLFGSVVLGTGTLAKLPKLEERQDWFIEHDASAIDAVPTLVIPGPNGATAMTIVRTEQLRSLLRYMLDEDEFLSPFGVRSVSRYHESHPYTIDLGTFQARLDYEPGESTNGNFGGNSNWRGPIWFPMNYLLIEGLDRIFLYYGDGLTTDLPTLSGNAKNLHDVAIDLSRRLTSIFLRGPDGRRPVNGPYERFNTDPHWSNLIAFHEYFHADTGRGCGASHQTGWTGLIAAILIRHGNELAGE